MIQNLIKSVGIVFTFLLIAFLAIISMYLIYIFGIGLFIIGSIAIVFYFLQDLRNKR